MTHSARVLTQEADYELDDSGSDAFGKAGELSFG
jgi:hypothetical protein